VAFASPLFLAQANIVTNLENGRSPNGRYALVLDRSSAGHLTYLLVQHTSGRVLVKIDSSYQPQLGELGGWAMRQASDARVFWNKTSELTAIEEPVHHGAGTVMLVQVNPAGAARQLQLPEDALLELTHLTWSKHRLFYSGGWIGSRELSLEVRGETSANEPRVVEMALRVRSNGTIQVKQIKQLNRTENNYR
jgi:hypothetical protein